jgi:hypothetical protein
MATTRKTAVPRAVTRAEFTRVLRESDARDRIISELQRTCAVQFERIAQMQAQIDALERALKRMGTR